MLRPINSKCHHESLSKAFENLSLEKKNSLIQRILEDIQNSKSKFTPLEQAKNRLDNVISWQPRSSANINNKWIQNQYKDAQKNYNALLHKKDVEELCDRGNTLSLK